MEIFKQRFNFAEITKYKSYISINAKDSNLSHTKVKYKEEPFFGEEEFSNERGQPTNVSLVNYPKRKTKFFSNDSDNDMGRARLFTFPSITTTKDRHIKGNYAEPFSGLYVTLFERKITLIDDKLTFSLYKQYKSRKVNCKFFKKRVTIYRVSINLKTGNVISIKNTTSQTHIRTNSFGHIKEVLKMILYPEVTHASLQNKKGGRTTGEVMSGYNMKFNHSEFVNAVLTKLKFIDSPDDLLIYDNKLIKSMSSELTDILLESVIKSFILHKKIKVHNDFYFYLIQYYPTEKFLKKNDRKLISSILDRYNFKSKSTIKILHQNTNLNLHSFFGVCSIFGDDYMKYMSKIDVTMFVFNNKSRGIGRVYNLEGQIVIRDYIQQIRNLDLQLSNEDKNNLVKYLNYSPQEGRRNIIGMVLDHFRMMGKIKSAGIPIGFKGTTIDKFDDEHMEFSKIVRLIDKQFIREYIFHEKTIKVIEKPIFGYELNDDGISAVKRKYIPVILKSQNEYDEEGKSMHHCVSSYIGYGNSMIISLRLVDNNDEIIERVTCEYNNQTGKQVQARGLQNRDPAKHFNEIIEKLDKRAKKLNEKDKLKWVETKQIRVKVNGIEIKSPLIENQNQPEVVRVEDDEPVFFDDF